MTQETENGKTPRDRSPSFPFIPLKSAIERLKEFEVKFGRQPPPADKTYLAWGYKGDTSQAQQTLAALKAFGLVDYQGSGPKRAVSISEDGRTYLRANQEAVRKAILKKIALKPPFLARIWSVWGSERHPDEVCLDDLIFKYRVNENTARRFLTVYDETIAYAELAGDRVDVSLGEASEKEAPEKIEVGDLIQIEISGQFKLEKPQRVRAIQSYNDSDWVFVESSETGFPMEQAVLQEKGDQISNLVAPKLALPSRETGVPGGVREDKASLDEGEVVLRWPELLSADSVTDFEYWINGIIRRAKRRAGLKEES